MVSYQRGDEAAFRSLYERHARALVNFFYKMCYDRATAEDLTQETFFRIIRYRANYRPESTFSTFLYTVARNLWIDQHRSRKAAPKTVSADARNQEDGASLGDSLPDSEQGVAKRLEDQEAAALVRRALGEIPEAQRMVFLMAEAQGLKYGEIAAALGIPVGTVKSRMHAAVTRLRGLLRQVLR
ncbi:MAG: RNA polymerase sigma factor [Planctomycetaceae bacterium]